jgi:hypothetical protein
MEYRFSTADILSNVAAEMVVSRLIYSMEGISNVYYDENSKDIVVEYTTTNDPQYFQSTIEKLVGQQQGQRTVVPSLIRDIKNNIPDIVSNKSIEAVFEFDGSVRRGIAVELYKKYDELFDQIAQRLDVQSRKYPSLIAKNTLSKCNYFTSFPQNVLFVSEFPHRIDVLEKVKTTDNYQELTRHNGFVLSPAVCFHCYEEFSNCIIDNNLMLTSVGTCYRHEAPWRVGGQRLNEFTMREVIFIGDSLFIEEKRQQFIDEIWGLFEELGFSGRIETASDPFYFPKDYSTKGQYQLLSSMKYELLYDNGKNKSFSIVSFNNVKDTLCKEFNIRNSSGDIKHSGCVAFGIDRWVYATLLTYGTDINTWPQDIKIKLDI